MQAVGPKNFTFGPKLSGSQSEREIQSFTELYLRERKIPIPQSRTFLGSKFYSTFFLWGFLLEIQSKASF